MDKKTAEDVKKKLEEAGAKVTDQAGRLNRFCLMRPFVRPWRTGNSAQCKKNAQVG